MLEISKREGTTEPIEFDLGEVFPSRRSITTDIDLQSATAITLVCQSTRDGAIIKSFTLDEDEIEVVANDDGNYARLRVTPTGSKLVHDDQSYRCYFLIVGADDAETVWPEGDPNNPHFVITVLEKLTS